jgi:hypothetical protein
VHFGYWLAWGGSLALSIALVVLMWTRWGHSQPLQKCAALSLLVHLILAFLTMTVRIVVGDGSGGGGSLGGPIHVRLVQDNDKSMTASASAVADVGDEVAAPELLEAPMMKEEFAVTEAKSQAAKDQSKITSTIPAEAASAPKSVVAETPSADPTPTLIPDPPTAKANESVPPPAGSIAASRPKDKDAAGSKSREPSVAKQTAAQSAAAKPATPAASDSYSLRNAPGRLSLIEGQGGNAKTEAAVVAALNWLVSAQSNDGRWNANQFGAGREQMVLGQDRGGAGRNADAGISALAVLAFLGAGHSHLNGQYRDTVHRGLDFLLRSQAADGNLFGDATLYAQMYCHSMATFALAEAAAMTGDRRLEPAVRNAVNYSLAAQNMTSGGWRYRPGDTGDTSQLGWQIMSLASAKRAGLNVPDQTWNRVDRFLRSVTRGTYGGLASYRPDSPSSTSMTAEALYCRLVLEEMTGTGISDSAANEATNQLLAGLPSVERSNFYYWYYATLALHHRQQSGEAAAAAWHTWNDAMTAALVNTQIADGTDAGSWDASSLWGGYGGRIYTTAMATMCLEVYYRYAPASEDRDRRTASRPSAVRANR